MEYNVRIIESQQLVRAQHIRIILSIGGQSSSSLVATNCMGKVLRNIVNFCCTKPMTRSTCILTLAIDLVSSTSNGDS